MDWKAEPTTPIREALIRMAELWLTAKPLSPIQVTVPWEIYQSYAYPRRRTRKNPKRTVWGKSR